MKAGQSMQCLLWTILYCGLCLISASEEDLADFDFTDLKEIDWNYEDTISTKNSSKVSSVNNTERNSVKFDNSLKISDKTSIADATENDIFGFGEDNLIADGKKPPAQGQMSPFEWREKMLRKALTQAFSNTTLRQKFIEVLPILRVLSKQQRLALSALISAQVNSKQGNDLKLDQVRMMFGYDKKLLIPILYDIANLIGNSARKYTPHSDNLLPRFAAQKQEFAQSQNADRRRYDLSSIELSMDDDNTAGVVPSASMPIDGSLEDFLHEVPDDVLDPQSINEELQASIETHIANVKENRKNTVLIPANKVTEQRPTAKAKVNTESDSKRLRRAIDSIAAATPTEFVHKLIRSVPLSINEEELQRGVGGRTVQLNTTSFVVPQEESDKGLFAPSHRVPVTSMTDSFSSDNIQMLNDTGVLSSYQEIEDLAFASLNGTEIELGSIGHSASNSTGTGEFVEADDKSDSDVEGEPLPSPEELIAGPRYRIKANGGKGRFNRPKSGPVKRKRAHVGHHNRPKAHHPPSSPQYSSSSNHRTIIPAPKKCERFTSSMCIRADDYPLDQIMGSIRRHKNAMTALLAEYTDKAYSLDASEEFDEFGLDNKRRREDEGSTAGSMCQTVVRYARPQKARSASGEWKYIVNTGQHTQTLRLEKCSNPQESCSYLAHNYRSHCAQIYNYHRLLSWDKTRGLHVDIFKVPTCCSCQVDGYRQQFPPLEAISTKDFTPAYKPEPYSTINDDLSDYNDEEDEDDLAYHFNSHHSKSHHHYDGNELGLASKNIHSKAYKTSPTVGAYLSPPGSNEYEPSYSHKGSRGATSKHTYGHQSQQYQQHQISRRRPYKSLSHLSDPESRADLDFAPSETHTDKEVNIFGTTLATDKTRLQQKRKNIYSVPHTATSASNSNRNANAFDGSSLGSTTASVTTAAATSTQHTHTNAHGHGYGHGQRGHRNGQGTGGYWNGATGSGSATSATANQTPAASPSFYAPSASQNVIVGSTSIGSNENIGKSKPRFRLASSQYASSPHSTATSPTASTAAFTPASSPASTATASPTETVYQYPISSAFPPSIYHVNSIFNTSNPANGPKRINYSYHPIIDFFENNKRSGHGSSFTTAPIDSSYTNTAVSSWNSPSSSQAIAQYDPLSSPSSPISFYPPAFGRKEQRVTLASRENIYPNKMTRHSLQNTDATAISNSNSQSNSVSSQHSQQSDLSGFYQYRKRRIGIGASGSDVGAVNGGVGSGSSINDDDSLKASADDNAWHPVLIEN